MLIQLIYTSIPVGSITDALANFIPKAKVRNDSEGITGIIVSDGNSYTQVLEGEQSQVNALFEDIKNDPRHTEVTLLKYCEIEEKTFSRWSMRHFKVHKLRKRSNDELLDRIFKFTDKNTKPKTLRNCVIFLMSFLLTFMLIAEGDVIEGKVLPPYTGLTANIIAEHPSSVEILIVGNRNRDRNCKLDNIVSSSEVEDFVIGGNTKILSMNDAQEERLILKLNIIPKGDFYKIELRSRCHLFWMTPQVLTFSD